MYSCSHDQSMVVISFIAFHKLPIVRTDTGQISQEVKKQYSTTLNYIPTRHIFTNYLCCTVHLFHNMSPLALNNKLYSKILFLFFRFLTLWVRDCVICCWYQCCLIKMIVANCNITNWFRVTLLVVAICLVVATYVLQYRASTAARIDACFIRREIQEPPPTIIPISDSLLHNLSVAIMWMAMIILSFLPQARMDGLHSLILSSLWFHTTYILLAAMKAPLADYNCAGRHPNFPNGVSGHYCYFIFVMLTAPRFAQSRLQANPNIARSVLVPVSMLIALFTVGAVSTLYRTFFHGYHSLRQILLGAALGIVSHVTLDYFHFSTTVPSSSASKVAFLLANSLTATSLYLRLWPHVEAGPAVGSDQLVFHLCLWFLLLITSSQLPNVSRKVATD